MGVTLRASTSAPRRIADVQKELGMTEGFDVGLEMSGNPAAFRDMLANMCHGGKIAMLGIPPQEMRHRLEHRHLQHAHHQGHLRPRDVRDLVQDDGDAADPGSTSARSSRTASRTPSTARAFDAMLSGCAGKVILEW